MIYWNNNDNGNDDRTQTLLRQNEIKKKIKKVIVQNYKF